MGCFKIVLDKLKKDVQRKMGNLSAVKISDEKFERLSERSSDKSSRDFKIPSWIEESNNPRVAMDFSYGVGRVVNDPKEAAEIARGESRGLVQPKTTRFQSLTPAPSDSLRFGAHLTQGYYHGILSREQAEEMVIKNGANGAFILRDSKNRPGCLVITYLHGLRPHHQYVTPVVLYDRTRGENIFLATCDKDTVFYDVHSLIEFHRLNRGSLQCVLTKTIKNPLQPDGTPPRHRKSDPTVDSPKSRSASPQVYQSRPSLQETGSLPRKLSDSDRQTLPPSQAGLESLLKEKTSHQTPITTTQPQVDLLTSLEIHSELSDSVRPLSPSQTATAQPSTSPRDSAQSSESSVDEVRKGHPQV